MVEKMNKRIQGLTVLILCFVSVFVFTHGDDQQKPKLPLSDLFRRTVSSCRDSAKAMINQVHSYFFPPNLDFRGSGGGEDKSKSGITDGGAGEKMKEAVAESIGKTKATVEDTAKSAAKIASETVQKTKEKVKRSFSDKQDKSDSDEL